MFSHRHLKLSVEDRNIERISFLSFKTINFKNTLKLRNNFNKNTYISIPSINYETIIYWKCGTKLQICKKKKNVQRTALPRTIRFQIVVLHPHTLTIPRKEKCNRPAGHHRIVRTESHSFVHPNTSYWHDRDHNSHNSSEYNQISQWST